MHISLKDTVTRTGFTKKKLIEIVGKGTVKRLTPFNHDEANPDKWVFDPDKIESYLKDAAIRNKQAMTVDYEQVDKMLNELWLKKKFRSGVQMAFSFYVGLRSVEISRLRISDVVDDHNVVKDRAVLVNMRTKTNCNRIMLLEHRLVKKFVQKLVNVRLDEGATKQDLLILSNTGKQYSANHHTKCMKRILVSHGLYDCSSHSGRRTYITNILRNGFDMKVAQLLAGHSNAAMTAKYYDPAEEDLSSAVLSLGVNLKNKPRVF